MRHLNLKKLASYLMIAVLGLSFAFTSCKKDKEDEDNNIVLDGVYIKGGATALEDFDAKGMLKVTRNEVNQEDRATLLEIYVAVKAGDEGFNIVEVKGDVRKTYGPDADFAIVPDADRHGDEPKGVDLWKGNLVENDNKFTVNTDGLYHVVIDTELNKVVMCKVEWGVIGAATPNGWNGSTPMPMKAFDLNNIVFEATDLNLSKSEFKYRYSDGWKIFLDTELEIGEGIKGVSVNTNFGGAVDALVPGGPNINNEVSGVYTATLEWKLGEKYIATLTKTGDIPMIDYSNYQVGIIGSCYNKADGTQAAWDENFGTHLPVVDGNVYTWTYNIPIIPGEFKFRQGDDWAGMSLGYNDLTWTGPAAGDFSDNGGNIKIDVEGDYTLVLIIDAATETFTVEATKN
ncbi:MAG: hypothetical protein WBH98_08830 [Bacteroidales bacterium]|jgi:hypothetical protein